MAWDQQGYYQDPYQQYSQEGYGYDQNYDAYGYGGFGYDEYGNPYYPKEDTESEKLRKDEFEKERIEALESNKLYLKKIKKHCVKEDFADLDKLQLFLFEVLVENMEVSTESVLGLVPDNDQLSYISARVQFLNSPWIEICERDMMLEGTNPDNKAETEYFQTIGEAEQNLYSVSHQDPSNTKGDKAGSVGSQEKGEENQDAGSEKEVRFVTKWENPSGKSCLFSETGLMIIRDIEKCPVILQAVRCVVSKDGKEACEPIGYAQVRLPDDFCLSIIQSSKEGVILPVSSVHRETLDIRNVFGVKKGKVELFLRLSSFGPAIITSFRSSGQERKYVFKPSPLDSNFKIPDKTDEPKRGDILKPIITEEESTVGITVQREYDFFQKPVLWKRTDDVNNCGCKNERRGSGDEKVSRLSSLGSLRLPLSSDISLCKDVLPPSVFRKLKFDKPSCDWHNIVSSGMKNSPGGNCGCLDSAPAKSKGKLGSACEVKRGRSASGNSLVPPESKQKYSKVPSTGKEVSRVPKMTHPTNELPPPPPTKGLGLMKECTDCGCDCPFIKDALDSKKLFLI